MRQSPFEGFGGRLMGHLPDTVITCDRPMDPVNGRWFLDVVLGRTHVVVETGGGLPRGGYGVSLLGRNDEGYGTGPDEFFPTEAAAVARARDLLGGLPAR